MNGFFGRVLLPYHLWAKSIQKKHWVLPGWTPSRPGPSLQLLYARILFRKRVLQNPACPICALLLSCCQLAAVTNKERQCIIEASQGRTQCRAFTTGFTLVLRESKTQVPSCSCSRHEAHEMATHD